MFTKNFISDKCVKKQLRSLYVRENDFGLLHEILRILHKSSCISLIHSPYTYLLERKHCPLLFQLADGIIIYMCTNYSFLFIKRHAQTNIYSSVHIYICTPNLFSEFYHQKKNQIYAVNTIAKQTNGFKYFVN